VQRTDSAFQRNAQVATHFRVRAIPPRNPVKATAAMGIFTEFLSVTHGSGVVKAPLKVST
jgi:hypothetical protein